jgi:hypothetical protein
MVHHNKTTHTDYKKIIASKNISIFRSTKKKEYKHILEMFEMLEMLEYFLNNGPEPILLNLY